MIKLLICLLATMATAACLMQLHQQRLELNHETSQLHNAIESRQARLWNQQLQIAKVTAPPAVKSVITREELRLTPLSPIGTATTSWLDSGKN
jgi:cell division protein FtsL